MKIEVDLKDIFCDDEGTPQESVQESIERQVVAHLAKEARAGVAKQVSEQVGAVISDVVRANAERMLPQLTDDLINAEYQIVDNLGGRTGGPTTFKKELVKILQSELVYKKCNYDSDKNFFTRAVDAVIAEHMNAFRSEFNKLVTDKFRAEALAYAVDSLKKSLGI